MLSKRQLNEKGGDDRNMINRPASYYTHSPSTAPRSELSILPRSGNANGFVDQRTLVERPNTEAHSLVMDTVAHEPETVFVQPHPNSNMNDQHQPKEVECNICGESTKNVTVHPCDVCRNLYCISCLKSMFLKACKDETLMPARCCQIIQLSIVLPHLSRQEADLYRAKFEEWSSSHRVYCPVPTCSAFIPSRLIPSSSSPTPPQSRHDDAEANGEVLENERQTPNQTVVFGTGIRMEIHTPPPTPPSTEHTPIVPSISPSPPIISCPQCAAQICVSCKQLKHPQRPCSEDDLDPELAALLKRWKIKRCPKCRTAVKRMYGCSHIGCRCGAQWCWDCLKPIDRCEDGNCTEGSEADTDEERENGDESGSNNAEAETMPDRRAMEDLDADDEEWAASGLNFGDEPSTSISDPWNCEPHSWNRVVRGAGVFAGEMAECHKCWRLVQATVGLADGIKMERGELVASRSVNATADSTTSDSYALPVPETAAYACVHCGLINCPACKTADASSDG